MIDGLSGLSACLFARLSVFSVVSVVVSVLLVLGFFSCFVEKIRLSRWISIQHIPWYIPRTTNVVVLPLQKVFLRTHVRTTYRRPTHTWTIAAHLLKTTPPSPYPILSPTPPNQPRMTTPSLSPPATPTTTETTMETTTTATTTSVVPAGCCAVLAAVSRPATCEDISDSGAVLQGGTGGCGGILSFMGLEVFTRHAWKVLLGEGCPMFYVVFLPRYYSGFVG